jgi:Ca-activated chloride channel family protein
MSFHTPIFLLLIPIVIFIILYWNKRKNAPGFKFSNGGILGGLKNTARLVLSQKLYLLRLAALILLVLALARPQSPVADSKIRTEGIDIIMALDCSTSMLAEDFQLSSGRRNRIEVVKEVVRDFISGRQNDRIGVVVFGARPYMLSPLTLDYAWLEKNMERFKAGMVEDGTAIGSGLASSVNRLRATRAKSKIITLLTDGRNNTGDISPLTAAEAAKALKVKVYTIGVGSKGAVPYPVKDFFGNTVYQSVEVDLDEETLQKIADITEARYFRATDARSLKEIYKEIDKLEKSTIEQKGYAEYNELFPLLLIPGLLILLLEIILSNTILRRLP